MTRASWIVVACVALGMQAVAARPAPAPRAGTATPAAVVCTFENPSYAGACVEKTTRAATQTPAAACQPILDCLNNPMCSKAYCRATTVRQGWTLKSAE